MDQTPTEAQAENERIMGTELGAQYSLLWQELALIHSNWAEYLVLFGTSQERVALLNEAAPSFCHLIQYNLWDCVLLHIARLTDPPKSSGKSNLSLKAMVDLIDRPATKAEAKKLIDVCVESAVFARDWRNRIIAHKDKDLHLALSTGSLPPVALEPASRARVATALKDLAAVLNCVSQDYLDSKSCFEAGQETGGALELLKVVNDGLAVRRDRRARLERGEYNAADFQGPSL